MINQRNQVLPPKVMTDEQCEVVKECLKLSEYLYENKVIELPRTSVSEPMNIMSAIMDRTGDAVVISVYTDTFDNHIFHHSKMPELIETIKKTNSDFATYMNECDVA